MYTHTVVRINQQKDNIIKVKGIGQDVWPLLRKEYGKLVHIVFLGWMTDNGDFKKYEIK